MEQLKKFLSLVRFSHTIFALPFALASLFVASDGLPSFLFFFQILLCMVTARNAAMAFNRLADADIDAENPRTKMRHLVNGALSKQSVVGFFLFNAVGFALASLWINALCFYLSFPILVILCAYSLFKRFSWLCHLFLGLAIGLSPIAVWIAARGEVAWFPVLLGGILMTWIAGFDIIYSTQDRKVDEELGLHSIPVRFGEKGALRLAMFFHIIMLVMMAVVPFVISFSWPWWVVFGLSTLLMGYIHLGRKSNSLDELNSDFMQANSILSVFVLVACLLEVYL